MNSKNKKPCILVVDDVPDEIRDTVAAGLGGRAKIVVRHPREIDRSDLSNSDLVLVDYRLAEWPERDALKCISTMPKTGMSLAAILREHVDDSDNHNQVTAFSLHTAHLHEVLGRLQSSTAQHVIARLNNLEWVFPKDEELRFEQMIILAKAIQELQFKWPNTTADSSAKLKSILELQEDKPWINRCWRDVRDCYSPVYELSTGEHQIQIVRWLLHQVMPYPCFLWDKHWVAARFQIPTNEFCRLVNGENQLAKDLNSMRYSGLLSGFLGERWWRGAIEDYVWNLTTAPNSNGRLTDALNELVGEELKSVTANPAIVCLDQDLKPKENFSSPSAAVRLQPDHWPAFADPAWIEIEDVKDSPALMAIVDPLDLAKIEDDHLD